MRYVHVLVERPGRVANRGGAYSVSESGWLPGVGVGSPERLGCCLPHVRQRISELGRSSDLWFSARTRANCPVATR